MLPGRNEPRPAQNSKTSGRIRLPVSTTRITAYFLSPAEGKNVLNKLSSSEASRPWRVSRMNVSDVTGLNVRCLTQARSAFRGSSQLFGKTDRMLFQFPGSDRLAATFPGQRSAQQAFCAIKSFLGHDASMFGFFLCLLTFGNRVLAIH